MSRRMQLPAVVSKRGRSLLEEELGDDGEAWPPWSHCPELARHHLQDEIERGFARVVEPVLARLVDGDELEAVLFARVVRYLGSAAGEASRTGVLVIGAITVKRAKRP